MHIKGRQPDGSALATLCFWFVLKYAMMTLMTMSEVRAVCFNGCPWIDYLFADCAYHRSCVFPLQFHLQVCEA